MKADEENASPAYHKGGTLGPFSRFWDSKKEWPCQQPPWGRLSAVNAAAGAHGLFFPIDLGADPSIGGMVGPLMFGFIMDRGAPQWVFGASVIVMILTASVALISDRRSARRRAVRRAATPAE